MEEDRQNLIKGNVLITKNILAEAKKVKFFMPLFIRENAVFFERYRHQLYVEIKLRIIVIK